MAEKNSFLLYTSTSEMVEALTDQQAGQLIKAIFSYVKGGEIPKLDSITNMAFIPIRHYLDADTKKYYQICEKRSEAGKKGGRPKKANGFSEKQLKTNGSSEKLTKAKKAEYEYEYEYEYDNEYDNNAHVSSLHQKPILENNNGVVTYEQKGCKDPLQEYFKT